MVLSKRMKNILMGLMFVAFTATTITLSVFVAKLSNIKAEQDRSIDSFYQSAYYGLVGNFVDIENDLAKVRVMTDSKLLRDNLIKIDVNCNLASQNLSVFYANNDGMQNIMSYVNQLGDYSMYLVKEIERGKDLTTSQMEALNKMWNVSKEYGKLLNSLQEYANDGRSFATMMSSQSKKFDEILKSIDNGSIEYPSLIYDGPFSDGVLKREAKGVTGAEITPDQGKKFVEKYLVGYDIVNIEFMSDNVNRIPSYLYTVKLKGDRQCSVQIAKKGGLLLLMDLMHEVDEPTLTMEQCKKVGEQYCESIGLTNMKAVWINNNRSNVYINMCYEQDGIINYADMVKLKISLDTGEVIGYEGLNYAFNHTKRDLKKPTISEEQAVLNVSAVLENIEVRLVTIPWNTINEKMAYEIVGELGGEKYFVYVDAFNGDELNVLRMIDSNQSFLGH
ncbi:MAG: germination protein YpeB [Clostridia bacterium]|nr:germination protein YpeB [Clostridia bacterium]